MFLSAFAALALTSCDGEPISRDCSAVDVSGVDTLPQTLSQTGLYSDIANGVLADNAIAFEPQFPLWTDGAKKQRWLVLPEGGVVDTSNPDDWAFPVGTMFFKEFALDGVALETRMNMHTEAGWTAVTYLWNEAGDDATRDLDGVTDIAGTTHDVPAATECLACHGGRRNYTLGFSATQLDLDTRIALYELGYLSDPVEVDIDLDPVLQAGLGVLHGNCSHCHNESRFEQEDATDCYAPPEDDNFDVTLPADLDDIENAPVMLTARFLLGTPGDSEILERMSERNLSDTNPSMPPLGTEYTDEDGMAHVEALVEAVKDYGGSREWDD